MTRGFGRNAKGCISIKILTQVALGWIIGTSGSGMGSAAEGADVEESKC